MFATSINLDLDELKKKGGKEKARKKKKRSKTEGTKGAQRDTKPATDGT